MKTAFISAILVCIALNVKAQCSTIGQTPASAFPVCGIDTFSQVSVPLCSSHPITVPGCDATVASYSDLNPFWYTFTCYASGTLGFLIQPNDLGDDYDWQLYDITNHNANDVFTDASLTIAGNWCGTYGLTGASDSTKYGAVPGIQCASDPAQNLPAFSLMPNIIIGHKYLLLISHYTNSQSGYQLTFKEGTGSITDPNIPTIQSAAIECNHQEISIKLTKQVRCNTLATDGSDFSLSSGLASIVSATGVNCGGGFDLDSIVLQLDNVLPSGNYTITAKFGADGNTLLDDCYNSVAVGDNASFAIVPLAPTPLDSIVPLGCAPNQLTLVFPRAIECNSIAADGSDFSITGASYVNILSASGVCDSNGLTSTIQINLAHPIVTGGLYQIKLAPGIDGNTIIDKCNLQTPSAVLDFSASDTVSARFGYQILLGCKNDSVQFIYNEGNGVNKWQWTFDSLASSTTENPLHIYSLFGNKAVQLIVSNGVCSDTAQTIVPLTNIFKADFSSDSIVCPEEPAIFTNTSSGSIISWQWNFGDGTNSSDSMPDPHLYPPSINPVKYNVSLIAQDNVGCYDTASRQITKVRSCYIDVPSAFTPNGDSFNDYLYPLNAYKAINLHFRVYNRYGQLVFETKDWTRKWDGTIGGKPQATGTYVWMLEYINRDTGKKYALKGTTVLIR